MMQVLGRLTAVTIFGCCLITCNAPAQLQVTDVKLTEEGAIRLSWRSETNTLYRIQYASEIADETEWQTLTDWYPSHGSNSFALDTGDFFRTPYVLHPRN